MFRLLQTGRVSCVHCVDCILAARPVPEYERDRILDGRCRDVAWQVRFLVYDGRILFQFGILSFQLRVHCCDVVRIDVELDTG